MTSEKLAQKFHTGGVLPRRSGSCFWVVVNLLHPIRSNSQMWVVARHHSLWDFCAHSADVILLENQWLRHENVGYFFRPWGSNRKVIAKIATGCRLCHFVAQYFCGERKTHLNFQRKHYFEHLIIIRSWNGIRRTESVGLLSIRKAGVWRSSRPTDDGVFYCLARWPGEIPKSWWKSLLWGVE